MHCDIHGACNKRRTPTRTTRILRRESACSNWIKIDFSRWLRKSSSDTAWILLYSEAKIAQQRKGQDSINANMHRFAAGVVPTEDDQSSRYELFRSYHAGESQTDLVLQGPEPADCRMPEVFAATGAAKFFLKPYKIGNTTFFDETFPQSHPISSIAFDEAKRLYGREVEISILLNIGPGIPADKDCQELDLMALDPISRLVGRFTWPSGRRLSLRQRLLSIGMPQPTSKKDSELTSPSEKALRLEDRRREDIKATPEETYGSSGAERYHHLGPAYSAEQASLNDVHALRLPRGDFDGLKQQSIAEAEDMVRKVWVDAVA
ncbi:hypothetical protein A1O7_03818 [Cladophialophora yegresii CBS 114405]|uniref:PNPLA domain-containing protein n=1 Tax=Cladophialophora yegresii CBS 114405 TaxID=1182544 RepID=W9VV81_9EURO|nr:uncharacterized protein A1O7_03818 [Cladophialophora yegresii CBS 114405]EXJ59672.1 hypothetical protein A1O7_03818 [Cladophialophora yegresii CBS 114405]